MEFIKYLDLWVYRIIILFIWTVIPFLTGFFVAWSLYRHDKKEFDTAYNNALTERYFNNLEEVSKNVDEEIEYYEQYSA